MEEKRREMQKKSQNISRQASYNSSKFEQLFKTHQDHYLSRLLCQQSSLLFGHPLLTEKQKILSQKKKIFSEKRASKITIPPLQLNQYTCTITDYKNNNNNTNKSVPKLSENATPEVYQRGTNHIRLRKKRLSIQPIKPIFRERGTSIMSTRSRESSMEISDNQARLFNLNQTQQQPVSMPNIREIPHNKLKMIQFLRSKKENDHLKQEQQKIDKQVKEIEKQEKETMKHMSKQEKKALLFNKWKKEQEFQNIRVNKSLSLEQLKVKISKTIRHRIIQFLLQRYKNSNEKTTENSKYLERQISQLDNMNLMQLKVKEKELGIAKDYRLMPQNVKLIEEM